MSDRLTAMVAFLLIALAIPAAAVAQDPPDYLQLAEILRVSGKYDACAVEALRHAHLRPERAPEGVDLAGRCLVQAGQWQQILALMWHPRLAPHIDASRELRWRACAVAATLGEVPLPRACAAAGRDDARLELLGAVKALAAGEWRDADRALALAQPATPTAAFVAEAQQWLAKSRDLPTPSPAVAAALSAAVPGLGRVYLGRWQEGATSLLLVGVPSWFAYGGFERDGASSVRGWLLASTAAVFYLGNIYGSWVGADVDRRKGHDRLRSAVRTGLGQWVVQ